jgi:hypothetical protein
VPDFAAESNPSAPPATPEVTPEPNIGEQGKTGEEISSDKSSAKKAGNNLDYIGIIGLSKGVRDNQKRKVYNAENQYSSLNIPDRTIPSAPDYKKFKDREEYLKAFREYELKFDQYKKSRSVMLLSGIAKKHLDGTTSGLQKYINEVVKSDWFQEKFGDGGIIGIPKARIGLRGAAGVHRISSNYLGGSNSITMNKLHAMDESAILHEISHYATAIAQTSSYQGHGVEFARNHLYILTNLLGSEYADGLKKQYRKSGAKFE